MNIPFGRDCTALLTNSKTFQNSTVVFANDDVYGHAVRSGIFYGMFSARKIRLSANHTLVESFMADY